MYAVERIFKSSVSTTINASSNDTSYKNHVNTAIVELTIPPNITAISNVHSEEMSIDGDEGFVILSNNLTPMRTTVLKGRKRKAKFNCNN